MNIARVVLLACAAALLEGPVVADVDPAEYQHLREQAEGLYAEGSYARANELYERALAVAPPAEKRWAEFRCADTAWRSAAQSRRDDNTVLERARERLHALVRDVPDADTDRVGAEVHESLGDFWWARHGARNWSNGWEHYRRALDFWAGDRDIEQARRRYLDIVWRMAEPPWMDRWHQLANTPIDVLENARRIAVTEEDRGRAHFQLAVALGRHGRSPQRIGQEFEAAVAMGRENPWYDDALYHYAQWLMSSGRVVLGEDGSWRQEPDFVRAVALLRKLRAEFADGETRYRDDAARLIEQITAPQLHASVSSFFLPESEQRFDARWRNVDTVSYVVYRVDLTEDVDPRNARALHEWIWQVDLAGKERVRSWSESTGDTGEHRWGGGTVRIEERLPIGAYLLAASAGSATARDLLLVTDAALVVKTWEDQVLAWVCDARDGSPIAGAEVRLWDYKYRDDRWRGGKASGRTDEEGLCRLTVPETRVGNAKRSARDDGLLITVAAGARQAFATARQRSVGARGRSWRVYATTDRPVYRPDETAHWKVTARVKEGGGPYVTPSEQALRYEITGPRGAKQAEGRLDLNAFGSAWSDLALTSSMPLGEYRITFWNGDDRVAGATLLRLEEYKLPEFEVAVRTPVDENGRRRAYRLGEEVTATIDAQYYFGGPVSKANVDVVVRQRPYLHRWRPHREFPWCYDDSQPWRQWWGEQVVTRKTIETDERGQATLTFETPLGGGQDLEYVIEARVTDSSRREISGRSSVRVTRQRFYVHPHARRRLYRPGDTVEVDFEILDANEQPVVVEGNVLVTRERWYEIWVDPHGRKIGGVELHELRKRLDVFPPPATPGTPPWRIVERGYRSEKILERAMKTDEQGRALLAFTAPKEGYYRVRWRGDDGLVPITAETTVWVADRETSDLAYHHQGVELIVDQDTFRAGQHAAVMISVPSNERWVLLTVEGAGLHEHRMVHVTGTVKLVEVAIDERHIPNVQLAAYMVENGQAYMDAESVVVPPVEQFLEVEVHADRAAYEPREKGTLTIVTRDVDGRGVPAEVSVGLVDDSVFSIQSDYAGDPREFFFNERQPLIVQTFASFNHKRFALLVDEPQEPEGAPRSDEALSERSAGFGVESEVQELASVMTQTAAAAPGPGRRRAAGRFDGADGAALSKADFVGGGAGPSGGEESEVVVRSDFRSTILWRPDVVTGADGRATVAVEFADSLTRWKATARAFTKSAQTGIGETAVRTRKPLIARLQAPRFFVVGDTVTLSGVLNNNTDEPMTVRPVLDAQGLVLTALILDGRPVPLGDVEIDVPAGGAARVDWQAIVESPGDATLRLTARSGAHADAMERTYAVHEHGIERLLARGGRVTGRSVSFTLDLPAQRKRETTEVSVQVAPTMAVTMLDALPYLVDYPYGCTEQTMSRFLPAAIVATTLRERGLSAEAALSRVFGGIERAHVDETHPKGAGKRENLRRLDEIVNEGVARLADFQHGDGGWGWWKGGESDHYMTAYVLWGLSLARAADLDVADATLHRAAEFLDQQLVEHETDEDLQAWMLHALAAWHEADGGRSIGNGARRALESLWTRRDRLNAFGRALLALAAHHYGDDEKAAVLVRNLENGVMRDEAPDTSVLLGVGGASHPAVIATAHWGRDGVRWRWSEGGIEATAFALRALLAIDPDHELVEPVTNWLVKNRRGAQWTNTRDTAIAVLALNDYLRTIAPLDRDFAFDLFVNGHAVASRALSGDDLLGAPSRFEVDRAYLVDGPNEIRIVRTRGDGPIYFSGEAVFFSLEEPIPASGNEVFVRRDYYRLVPRETLLKGFVYDRQLLRDGDYVTSGDRVEVVVTMEAKNDAEYLVLEDLKPAGLEAVELRSGGGMIRQLTAATVDRRFGAGTPPAGEETRDPGRPAQEGYTGRTRWVHQELRDRKVAMFVDRMSQGTWEIRYDLRAEVPGQFHALPLMAHAMYVPEIRANSEEIRLTVQD